jgi:hypothetical protein
MSDFENTSTNLFLNVMKEFDDNLPPLPPEDVSPVAAEPAAQPDRPTPVKAPVARRTIHVPLTPQPPRDAGVDIFRQENLPVQAATWLPEAPKPKADVPQKTEWWKGKGVGSLVLLLAAGAGVVGVIEHTSGGEEPTAATGASHAHHRHADKKHHDSRQPLVPTASSAPSVGASPNAHPDCKLTPYVFTQPSTATETAAPTPSAAPTTGPTPKPQGSANGGAAFNVMIGTQNQKNHLSYAKHIAAAKLVVSKGIDILGSQETGWLKYHAIRPWYEKHGYDVFPKTHYKGWDQLCSRDEAVFYKTGPHGYTLVKHELLSLPQYPLDAVKHCGHGESAAAGHANAPVLWLRNNETGREIIEINYHNIANVKMAHGVRPARIRKKANHKVEAKVERLREQNPGVPIFVTCDCNEGTGVRHDHNVTLNANPDNLMSHQMKQSGLMKDAACLNHACHYHGIGGVDFIYRLPGVKVKGFHTVATGGPNSDAPSFSDHPLKYGNFRIPSNFSVKSQPAHHHKRVSRR